MKLGKKEFKLINLWKRYEGSLNSIWLICLFVLILINDSELKGYSPAYHFQILGDMISWFRLSPTLFACSCLILGLIILYAVLQEGIRIDICHFLLLLLPFLLVSSVLISMGLAIKTYGREAVSIHSAMYISAWLWQVRHIIIGMRTKWHD